jgi:carbon storage regulator
MLVLSRHCGESIVIGGTVRVVVLEVDRHGQVRLGIEAPQDVPVDRAERLAQRRAQEKAGRPAERED